GRQTDSAASTRRPAKLLPKGQLSTRIVTHWGCTCKPCLVGASIRPMLSSAIRTLVPGDHNDMTFLLRFRFALVWLAPMLLAIVQRSLLAAEAAAIAKAMESVTTEELQKHAEFLADDTLEGREAGSRGGQAA